MNEARIETKSGEIVPLKMVTAIGDLAGVFLRMSLRQHFHNPTDHPLEVTYSFPLPQAAVLLAAEIHIRGQIFHSQVSETPSASARYDDSIKAGDTAILITHNADFYTMRLGNVPAGEAVIIHIRYGEWLTPNDDMVRISLPTTIAPRYGTPPAELTPDQVPVTSLTVEYPFSYALHIHECTLDQVSVPSHVAHIAPLDGGVAVAIESASMDRDVVVQVRGYAAYRANMTAFHQKQYWHGTYLTIPHKTEAPVALPMHIKLLIDCSGSMGGSSIAQARQAVMRVLGMLRDGDSIAVTRFGSNVVDVTPGLMNVGAAVRKQMNNWTKTIEADLGGTEIARAIQYVLAMPTHNQPCDIVMLTDGEAWGIREVATAAKASGHRVFPVVIGHAPADGDLRTLAKQTGGFCETVTPNERIDVAMERIARRLQSQSAQQVALSFGNAVVAWEDGTVPTYSGDTSLVVTVTDQAADASFRADDYEQTLPSVPMPAALTEDFVRTLAAKRINSMTGESQTKWAVKHQLVAPGTALVAIAVHEEDAKVKGQAVKAVVMQEMAYGYGGGQPMRSFAPAFSADVVYSMSTPMRTRRSMGAPTASPPPDRPQPGFVASLPKWLRTRNHDTDGESDMAASHDNSGYTAMARQAKKLIGKTTPTFAHLRQAGFSEDIIAALQSIAGYSEAQIVAAVIDTVLGTQKWADASIGTLPDALLGGVRIILATA